METSELEKILSEKQPIKVSYNGGIVLEFSDGLIVTVCHTTEWDCSVWDIESNYERDEQIRKWQQVQIEAEQRKKEREEIREAILAKFPENERDKVLTVINQY